MWEIPLRLSLKLSNLCLLRFYVHLRRIPCVRPGVSPFQYEGIVSTSRKPCILNPGILGNHEGLFHVYTKLEQKITTPLECCDKLYLEWPACYNSGYFKSPLLLSFEYYAHKDEVKMPNTRDDLYNHVLLGVSYVELYKGGAGFKAVEFKYIQHDPEVSEEASVTELHVMENLKRSLSSCDDFFQYVSPHYAFLEGLQNGYSGPIVSYWSRLSDSPSLVF